MNFNTKNFPAAIFLLLIFISASCCTYLSKTALSSTTKQALHIITNESDSPQAFFDPFEENEEDDKEGEDDIFALCFIITPFIFSDFTHVTPNADLNKECSHVPIPKHPLFLSHRSIII
jgi:hypothetical protein